jgi:DNA sulfur modification protein DndD
MKIRRVHYLNFRQHEDLNLDLEEPGSDFVVIHGENGEGKTNLLNGILWCFYGNEGNSSDPGNRSNSLVSRGAQARAELGEILTACVEITLEFSEGLWARVERKQDFKVGEKSAEPYGKSRLKIVTSSRGAVADATSVENPEVWLEERFPERLRHYFLFDGEELDSFFNATGRSRTVEDAVLQVTQVDVLTRMIDRLSTIRSSFEADVAKKTTDRALNELQIQLVELDGDVENIVAEITELTQQADRYSNEFQGIEREIGQLLSEAKDRETFAAASGALKELTSQLDDARIEHAVWAATEGYLGVLANCLSCGLDFVTAKRESGEVPASVKPEALKSMLEEKRCLCGNHLEKGDDGWVAIESLLRKNELISLTGEEILDFESSLQVFQKNALRVSERDDFHIQKVERLLKKHDDLEDEVEQLKKKIPTSSNGQERLKSLQDLQTAQQANAAKITGRELALAAKKQQIEEKRREFDKAVDEDSALQELSSQIQFTDQLLKHSQKIFKELSDSVRADAQKVLNQEFQKMIWKEDYIENVQINDGFEVQVFDNRGFEILNTLSAGESACLAFAFALALNKVSGYEMPMVIDTPLGRMSPDVQAQVARSLATNTLGSKTVPSQQVILLMTGTEYNKDVKTAISERKPLALRLRFDTEESRSSMEDAR